MTNLSDVAKASTKSSFYLFLGKTSSTIIMAIASIIVARLLGPENYGLYTVALIVPSLLIPISDLGISPALTRFSAKLRSEDKEGKAASLIKTGIILKLLFSIVLSIALFLLSEVIAINVLKRPQMVLLTQLGSLYIFGLAVLSTVDSIYIGLDETEKSGLLMNIQAITKAVISPLLIILGLGVIGATLGAGLGYLLASGIGITMLLLHTTPALYRRSRGENINFSQGSRLMVAYGMPLYIVTLLLTLSSQYQYFILALFTSNVANVEIGNYSTAMNFSTLITLLTYAITAPLFPAFSKLTTENDRGLVKKMFRLSVKYSSLLVIPASLALSILSSEFVYAIYGTQYGLAPSYLTLYALNFLTAGLGALVLWNFFNGQGDTKTILKINLINIAISLPLVPILTVLYGVLGLITSVIITGFLSTIYGLSLARRKYGVTVDLASSLRIGIASFSSALLVYVFLRFYSFSSPVYRLAAGGSVYLVTFLVFAPLFGAINKEDIENLNDMTRALPLISPIVRRVLNFEEKILDGVSKILDLPT